MCRLKRLVVLIKSELGEMKNTKKLQADPVNVKTATKRRQLQNHDELLAEVDRLRLDNAP